MGNGTVYGRKLSKVGSTGPVAMIQELRWRTNLAFYRPSSLSSDGNYTAWHWNSALTLPQGYSTIHDFDPGIAAGDNGRAGGNLLYTDQSVAYRRGSELRARDFGLADGTTGKASDTQDEADGRSYRSAAP